MPFTRDPVLSISIRRIERGRLTIGDADFEHAVAVSAEGVIENVAEHVSSVSLSELSIADLQPLLDRQPDVVILGTGWSPGLPPRELTFAMARRGIGFEVMATPAACRTFNILIAEDRRPAALLFVD